MLYFVAFWWLKVSHKYQTRTTEKRSNITIIILCGKRPIRISCKTLVHKISNFLSTYFSALQSKISQRYIFDSNIVYMLRVENIHAHACQCMAGKGGGANDLYSSLPPPILLVLLFLLIYLSSFSYSKLLKKRSIIYL